MSETDKFYIPKRNKKEILVIGHRGNAKFSPENTKKSYETAINLGADIIETDVRITKDGVLVFQHDDTIDRNTNGKGPIAEKTFDELRGYDFGYSDLFGEKFKGERIFTVEEGIKLFKERKVAYLLEIKTPAVIEPLSKLIAKLKPAKKYNKFLVWSTNDSQTIIKYMKGYDIYHLAPIDGFINTQDKDAYFKDLKSKGITGFSINMGALFGMDKKDTDLFLILAAKYKMPVGVWTVDSTAEINRAMEYQVKGIIKNKTYIGKIDFVTTNDPAKAILLSGKNLK